MKNFKINGIEFLELNKVYPDNRGFFLEVFKNSTWPDMKQSNMSFSNKGVVRGLHYQVGEHAQQKIVQCVQGKILDVILDIRPSSPTFGMVETVELTPGNGAVSIHQDLAHGFWALEDSLVLYHCSKEYAPDFEGGINPNSKHIDLPWYNESDLIISDKDQSSPYWRSYVEKLNNINIPVTGRYSGKSPNKSTPPRSVE